MGDDLYDRKVYKIPAFAIIYMTGKSIKFPPEFQTLTSLDYPHERQPSKGLSQLPESQITTSIDYPHKRQITEVSINVS